MWILILSITAWGFKAGGPAITTAEFSSYAACAKAGETFIRQHTREDRGTARWSCTKK